MGAWCPLLAIRSCFVEFAQRSSCSFDKFVGEKVISPSYSSAILAPVSGLSHSSVCPLPLLHCGSSCVHWRHASTQVGLPNTRYHCFCVSCSKRGRNPTRAVTALRLCMRTLGKFYLHCACQIVVISITSGESVDVNYYQHLTWSTCSTWTLWRATFTFQRPHHDEQQLGQVAQVQSELCLSLTNLEELTSL